MRKLISTALTVAVLATALIKLSSCEKDEGKLPNIAFKTTAGYTFADVTKNAGDTLTVGITASKAEDKDVLKTFNVSKSVSGGASATITNTTLTSAQEDNYATDYTIVVGTGPHTEKWTFTVTNRDGLTNSVAFTVTVN